MPASLPSLARIVGFPDVTRSFVPASAQGFQLDDVVPSSTTFAPRA